MVNSLVRERDAARDTLSQMGFKLVETDEYFTYEKENIIVSLSRTVAFHVAYLRIEGEKWRAGDTRSYPVADHISRLEGILLDMLKAIKWARKEGYKVVINIDEVRFTKPDRRAVIAGGYPYNPVRIALFKKNEINR